MDIYTYLHSILTISADIYNHYHPHNEGQNCNNHCNYYQSPVPYLYENCNTHEDVYTCTVYHNNFTNAVKKIS